MSLLRRPPFRQYFPHSAGFSPACKRPEFVKKSHFLDETTSTETTSYLKNENNFSLLWSLQMTKVLCGRALDSAIAPNRGIALPGPKKWRKIDPMISILGDPSLFVRPYFFRSSRAFAIRSFACFLSFTFEGWSHSAVFWA